MNKTQEVYDYIESYIIKNNYPPTIREIGNSLKLDSTSSVSYHLDKLEKQNKIIRNGSKNRAIELVNKPIINSIALPVVGTIAAGQPILAEQNIEGYFPIPTEMVPNGESFVLKVKVTV